MHKGRENRGERRLDFLLEFGMVMRGMVWYNGHIIGYMEEKSL